MKYIFSKKCKKAVIIVGCLITCGSCKSVWLYHPDPKIYLTPAHAKLQYEDIQYQTEDGLDISAWFIKASPNRGVVLFCHGNAGNISTRIAYASFFHHLGFSTFLFDYRGFGKSKGEPSEEGTYLDAEATWKYLTKERAIPAEHIVIWGKSLGGSIAAWLASQHTPAVLVLESSFSSLANIVDYHCSCVPTWILVGDDYNTAAYVQQVRCPILIMHSKQDEVIPFTHGEFLYHTASEPKQFIEILGRHNDTYYQQRKKYIDRIELFLHKYYKR